MRPFRIALVFVLSLLATMLAVPGPTAAAGPSNHASVGPGCGQVTGIVGQLPRDGVDYAEHCDGTFENGYAWWASGQGEPYFGGFAERYDVGPAEVTGIRLYLTGIGNYNPELTEDLFVWGHGIDGQPGAVLGMVPSVPVEPYGVWPNVTAHDFEISASVGATFYVGCQANWPWEDHVWWFNAVDLDGPMGEPWTCILPDVPGGYPSGWQSVDMVWGEDAHSMGIGVYYDSGVSSVPVQERWTPSSWGMVKELFHN